MFWDITDIEQKTQNIMGMGCGAECLKAALIIFNVLFWMCGGALLGVGVWMAVDDDAFDTLDILNPEGMDFPLWKAAVFTMIGVGGFVFLVGFLGWLGACLENNGMLLAYSILAGIALVAEVACVVFVIIFNEDIDNKVEAEMSKDIRDQYTTADDTDNSYVTSWNNFQIKRECCGSYNFTDWHRNPNYGPSGTSIPWTCCRMVDITKPPNIDDVIDLNGCYNEGMTKDPNDQAQFKFVNNIGCHEALTSWVKDKSAIIYGLLFGFMGLEVLAMSFGCVLISQIQK